MGVTVCPYTDVANHISDLLQEREDKAWVRGRGLGEGAGPDLRGGASKAD